MREARLPTVRDEILGMVREALFEFLPPTWDPGDLRDDASLDALSAGGIELDSVDLLTAVVAIEFHFGVDLGRELMVLDPWTVTWGEFLDTVGRHISALRGTDT